MSGVERRGIRRRAAVAAAALLCALLVAHAPAAAAQETTPVCEKVTELAKSDSDLATLVFEILDSAGVECPLGPEELLAQPAEIAELLAAAADEIADEAAATDDQVAGRATAAKLATFALSLDADNATAGEVVEATATPPDPADPCRRTARFREEGNAAATAAGKEALGEDCKETVAGLTGLAGVMLAAAETELAGDSPDREKARSLLDAAETLVEEARAAGTEPPETLTEAIAAARDDAADPPLESLRDDIWDNVSDGVVALALLIVGFLLLWLVARLVGQLDMPTRWWRKLLDTGTPAVRRFAASRWARWSLLLVAVPAAWGALHFAREEGWLWLPALVLAWIGFISFSLWVHGPHVRFQIEAFGEGEKDPGPGVAKLLGGYLRQFGSSEAPAGLKGWQRPDAAVTQVPELVGELGDKTGIAKAILGLMGALIPDRSYRLRGDVHQSGDTYLLTLTLEHGSRVVDSTQVTAKKAADADSTKDADAAKAGAGKGGDAKDALPAELGRLAMVGAVWVSLTLGEATGAPAPIYGSRDWRSAALAATAVDQPGDDNTKRLRCAYALERDPANRVAAFKLGSLDLAAMAHDSAIARLRQSLPPEPGQRPDRYEWYRVQYNLAVAYFNAYLCYRGYWEGEKDEFKARRMLRAAQRTARELYEQTTQFMDGYEETKPRRRTRSDDRLYGYLRGSTLKPAAVLLADAQQECDKIEPADWSPFYTGSLINVAKSGPITARTHYNLACFYSNKGEFADSLQHLALGLEGGEAEWAGKDPGLYLVRRAKRKAFDKVLAVHGKASADKPALAGLASLTDADARKLWLIDPPLLDGDGLIERCGDADARYEVAEKSGVDEGALRAAALLADLEEQIQGTGDFAALLFAAGLGSVQAFKDWGGTAAELRERLALVRRQRRAGAGKLPSPTTIQSWLADAATTTPAVA